MQKGDVGNEGRSKTKKGKGKWKGKGRQIQEDVVGPESVSQDVAALVEAGKAARQPHADPAAAKSSEAPARGSGVASRTRAKVLLS